MSVPLSAPSHDTTRTDMLLPGVHGEAAEEEANMLQPSITHQPDSSMLQPDTSILQPSLSHQPDTSILQPSLSHQPNSSILQQSITHQPNSSILQQSITHQTDSSLLQQSISHHADSSLLQASMSHTQGSEESLIQSEDLTSMQLMGGDCNTVLQCDLSNPQTSLSVDSLGHSTTPLQYNDTNTSAVTSLTHNSSLHCDLSVSSLSASLSHSSSHLPSIPTAQITGTSGHSSSQNAQPTYITTTVPISSLLHPSSQQPDSSENMSDSRVSYSQTTIQSQPAVKPTILPNNILQQAIALNIPTNIVTALANMPFFTSNQSQTPGPNTAVSQTQNVIPIAPAPVSSMYQTLPTNLFRNFHGPSSANQVPLPQVLQKVIPDTQKPPESVATLNSNAAPNVAGIPISAVLSGTTVFCASGSQSVAQLDSTLLPQILNSFNGQITSSGSTVVQSHPNVTLPVTIASGLVPTQSMPSAVVGTSLASSPALPPTVTSASSGLSSSATLTTNGSQISAEQSQAATYLSQFPMPVPVMSTQESSNIAASDLQSLQTCLSHPLIQSLSQQNLVTSLASQIILNPSRAQGTASPSFPQLAQVDTQQTGHVNLLRQTGYNLPDSDTSAIMSSMSSGSIQANNASSASPQTHMENYAAAHPSGLSPGIQASNMLPSVALSPSESLNTNLTTRLFLTSPVTVVPLSHDTQTQEKAEGQDQGTVEPSGPAFTLANMSVIDMLLKHPTDLPDVDRAALPHKETHPQPTRTKTPKISGIYCVDCNNSYKDGCRYHKVDYTYVPDRPVLSRAKLTLPVCFVLQTSGIKITSEEVNNLGVFANESVAKKTQFGPLIGKIVSDDTFSYTNSFTWKIFYNGHHSVIDVSDEEQCNWMIYVKPAPTLQDQNIVVYQQEEELYFVVNKDIEPGTELLFWFAKDYAKLLGLPVKPSQLWPSNCPFCHVCNKVLSDWKALSKHMKTEHPNSSSRKWPCQMCNRRFTSSTKLKTHMVALHMRLKPFSCPHCGKKFSDQSNLRQHQNIHTGERRFKCGMCMKSFRQKAHLQSHMIVHTGGEGLQCRFCSAKIARASDLKAHELKHTKEKCYPCALCVKVFYKLSNYKKHMLVHNKERKFSCADCGKSFYSRYHLTRHLKTCKRAKLGGRGLGGSEENLYSTLDRDPQVEIDIVHDDSMILNTTTSITARLRTQRQDR